MSLFGSRNRSNGDAMSAPVRSVERSMDRDPLDWSNGVRIVRPTSEDGEPLHLELDPDSVLHIAAQYVAQGRAQVADYAASASAAIREILADARSRRFEAVQQAKARRLMLQSYRAALQRQADAQRILGPHVRFSGAVGKNLWVFLFLMGDAAGMTLALTYGGESPVIAGVMALAVGAAVVVSGKLGEELRRESFVKRSNEFGDDETARVVEAVFGIDDASRRLNRNVLYAFMGGSSLAGAAITVYRSFEESFGIGIAFGMWALLIGAGSFAASFYYCDPARTFIDLTQQAVADAEDLWRSAEIDAIEEHNGNLESAKHIISEHRVRAEAAWHMTLAGAAAAMAANSDVIGIAQKGKHWILEQRMPQVMWPDISDYLDIIDQDDVRPDVLIAGSLDEQDAPSQHQVAWDVVIDPIDDPDLVNAYSINEYRGRNGSRTSAAGA